MSKPFNIHNWQAKQRLTEIDAYQKRQDAQTPGKNPEYFYDKDSIIGKLKKDPDYIKKLNAKNAKKDVAEAKNPELLKRVNRFIKKLADDNSYSLQAAVNAIMGVLRSQNYDGVNEHHAGDYNPGFLKQSVSTFLDKLKKKTDEGKDYETVEKIMEKHFSAKKEVDEVSVGAAGPGATSIDTSGRSMAYPTKNAFKKKTKKD
jgi:hypothetical protein